MRDLEENLYVEIRNAKSIRNEIVIFNKGIDFSNEIIDIINKKKLCDVLVDVNIENFADFFSRTFLLIFIKKLFLQFKIEFDEKNNVINVIV